MVPISDSSEDARDPLPRGGFSLTVRTNELVIVLMR